MVVATCFEYTSGRFLCVLLVNLPLMCRISFTDILWFPRFTEELRRPERRLQFDVDALAQTVCRSVGRPVESLASITKLAEGGFNRVLQATFDDGYEVIARLPYRTTVPECYAVASEAATLDLLRSRGVPVPKVLGYSPDRTNPVGIEYALLEKIQGTPLSDQKI
jgi:aminoglycoside phosphotransferase (APT) family kinase protein